MKKFAFALVSTVVMVGFVLADDFTAVITKVDGNKIEFKKYTGTGKDKKVDDTVTKAEVAADAKVFTGMFNKDSGKVEAGDALKDGLKNEKLSAASDEKGKSVNAMLTTDGGKVTKIIVMEKKKKNQ
jgi:hypothetical protein